LFGFLTRTGYSDRDPLANRESAELFARTLPLDDPVKTMEALCDALSIAARNRNPNEEQLAVLLGLDLRTERLRAELLRNSIKHARRSWPPENTLWQALSDLSLAFQRAYARFLRLAREMPANKAWLEHAPRTLVQFLRHWQIEHLLCLFRYEQLGPARWRELHEAYWTGRPLRTRNPATPKAHGSETPTGDASEHEYLQILVLQLLNNGEFTPAEVFLARERIAVWSKQLCFSFDDVDLRNGNRDAQFVVDIAGTEALKRAPVESAVTPVHLDLGIIVASIDEEMESHRDPAGSEADSGPHAQLLPLPLLAKLATAFSAKTARLQWRAERDSAELVTARVVAGLSPIIRTLHDEWQQLLVTPRAPGPFVDEITITDVGGSWRAAPGGARMDRSTGPRGAAPNAFGEHAWRIKNRSDSGTLLRGRVDDPYRVIPGSLIALHEGDASGWTIAVVRRLKRIMRSTVEIGVEHIGRSPQGVSIAAVPLDGSAEAERERFAALFFRGSIHRPGAPIRTLLLPANEFAVGRRVTLLSTSMSYTMRLKEPLEAQSEFVWSAFEIVAKHTQAPDLRIDST